MAEKRAQNSVKEVQDAKSNEALRRKAGKVRTIGFVQIDRCVLSTGES